MSFMDLELKPEYRSRLDNVIRDFYVPVLKQSVMYKRAVGFFSSSALLSLTVGISGLVNNGGSIQLIASPRLSQEDIDAINDGLRRRDEVIKEALLRELHEPKGKFEEKRLNLLSNLIAAGRLEIKIAFLEDDNTIGMFHEKLGLAFIGRHKIPPYPKNIRNVLVRFDLPFRESDFREPEAVLLLFATFPSVEALFELCSFLHTVSF